jgi:hypothetical protein
MQVKNSFIKHSNALNVGQIHSLHRLIDDSSSHIQPEIRKNHNLLRTPIYAVLRYADNTHNLRILVDLRLYEFQWLKMSNTILTVNVGVHQGHCHTCYILHACQPHQTYPSNLCRWYYSSIHGQWSSHCFTQTTNQPTFNQKANGSKSSN